MRRFWLVLGAFLGALVVTWIAAMAVYVLGASLGWFFDRDGGAAMGTAFVIGPSLGILMGLLAALVVGLRARRPPSA